VTPHDIRQQVTALGHNYVHIRTRIHPVLIHLAHQIDALDGYKPTASGADTGPGGGTSESSITERHALQRINDDTDRNGPSLALADICEYLATANHAVNLALRECDRHTPGLTREERARFRCIGTGDQTGATCGQLASPRPHPDGHTSIIEDGRCLDCGRIWDRLERERTKERQRETDARRARRKGQAA
jgi:hypothetical protein